MKLFMFSACFLYFFTHHRLKNNYGENIIISLSYFGKFVSFLKTSNSTFFLKEKIKLHMSPLLGTVGTQGLQSETPLP